MDSLSIGDSTVRLLPLPSPPRGGEPAGTVSQPAQAPARGRGDGRLPATPLCCSGNWGSVLREHPFLFFPAK